MKRLAAARASMKQVCAPGLPRSAGIDRVDAEPQLRSSETLLSKIAWPAGSHLSQLLETPPIARPSIASHLATAQESLKSNSSHVVSRSLKARFCGVGAVAAGGKMRPKEGDRDEPW